MRQAGGVTILMADDDPDDRLLLADAFQEARQRVDLRFVGDGEELLDYLRQRGEHADPSASPRPSLILLDLNMPRKDGREALAEIKRDPALCQIPVVVLTTSAAEEDVCRAYALGGNSYITKPATFSALVDLVRTLGAYWLAQVALPHACGRDGPADLPG